MRVIAFNGSPKKDGNTATAIRVVLEELEKEGISTEIIHIGNKSVRGCMACGGCAKNMNERCVIEDDVNKMVQKMKEADGIILGSPVYYAAMSGTMKSFLDRAFYVAGRNNSMLRHKVGASVVAVRRSGEVTTFNQLNNYFLISEMLMPSSNYWNVTHGATPGETVADTEGMQTMKVLGQNMAWLMKIVEFSRGKIPEPQKETKIYTNFIR